jgi:hypothetical protein
MEEQAEWIRSGAMVTRLLYFITRSTFPLESLTDFQNLLAEEAD